MNPAERRITPVAPIDAGSPIYRHIVEGMSDAFVVVDKDWRITYANPAAIRRNNKPASEFLGRTLWEEWPCSVGNVIEDSYRQAVRDQLPTRFRQNYRNGDQDEWIEIGAYPTPDGGLAVQYHDITDLIRKQEQLLQAKRYLRAHVENTPLALVEFSGDYVIQNWSKRAEEIFGWTAAEVVGRPYTDLRFVFEADIPLVEDIVAKMLSGESLCNVTNNRNYCKDGSVIHCAWYNSVLLDESGKPSSIFSLALDVTGRVKAEQNVERLNDELRQRVSVLEKIVEVAPVGLGITEDTAASNIHMNRELARMLGLPLEANASMVAEEGPAYRVLSEGSEVPRENLPLHQAAAQGKVVESAEFDIVRPDGSVLPMLAYSAPLVDESGKPWGAVGAYVDISERRKADAERERLLHEHAWYRNLLETMMENIPEGITIADAPDVRIRMASRYGLTLIGKAESEIINLPLGEHTRRANIFRPDGTRPDDKELPLSRAVILGETVRDEEFLLLSPNGNAVTMLCTAAPLRGANGEITGGVVAWRDISERKRMEQELRRHNAEMLQLSYAVSHDLKEPLRMIRSFSDLLSREYSGRLDAKADRFIASIVKGATRMDLLLRDLLAYARAGREDNSPERVDCNAALEQARQNLGAVSGEVTSDPLPQVMAGRVHVVQIFQNLIGNALKYRRKGVAPRVHCSATRQLDGKWVISVADNGIGIDPDYRDYVFGMFRRLHRQDDYEGTGIGLALCKRIVDTYGGRIWVESRPGEGSTFHFTLRGA